MAYGNAVKRFFPGMTRSCPIGHGYEVTESMSRRGTYTCPKCASAAAVEYARRNREKKRAWNNAYMTKRSAKRAGKTRAYRERHPEKKAAHQAVATAIRNGSLIRGVCEKCGAARTAAHHDDYSKPLAVSWLCHQHHMERHQMLEARKS